MFETQHLVDLQGSSGFGPKSWISGEEDSDDNSSTTHHRTQSSLTHSALSNANVDRLLYNDLVEMIPLVQSLIERKANSSFTRRGSMIYTKTPSLSRKVTDIKGRNAAQSIHVRKKKDQIDKNDSNSQDFDGYSIFSLRTMTTEKENELVTLKEQLEDLQRKLLEKDELLKLVEIPKNEINDIHAELEKLKQREAEKDSLIKSIQMQLCDAKIKLADKQAALEKTQWETMMSKQKVEKLQNDIDSMQGEFSSFMLLLNGLTENNHPNTHAEDYDVAPYHLDHLPCTDDVDDKGMQKMEDATQAYVSALATAKEKQDEESLAAAASARRYLQSFLFRSEGAEESNVRIS